MRHLRLMLILIKTSPLFFHTNKSNCQSNVMTFNVPANHKDLLKSAGSAIQVLSSTVKNAGMKAQAPMVQPPANPQPCREKCPKTWTYFFVVSCWIWGAPFNLWKRVLAQPSKKAWKMNPSAAKTLIRRNPASGSGLPNQLAGILSTLSYLKAA